MEEKIVRSLVVVIGTTIAVFLIVGGVAMVFIDAKEQSALSEEEYCAAMPGLSLRNLPAKCLKYYR